MTITFCLVPYIPLGVLREHSGFNRFPYSILIGELYFMVTYMKNYSCSWTIKYDIIILVSYSQCQGNNVTIIKLLVWWRLGFKMHKIFRISSLLAGDKTLFLIDDKLADETLDKCHQPSLEFAISGRVLRFL